MRSRFSSSLYRSEEKGEGTGQEKEVCQEKRGCPARGKRYSPAQKQEILEYALAHDVQSAAEKFQLTGASIYEWRRCLKRRGVTDASDKEIGKIVIEDSKAERDRKILAMWRQHQGYGPSQIRNMLKRGGFKVIAGWAMVPAEAADPVIESFERAVERYGRPEGVMTDRSSAFHSWKGLSRFEALLEEYEINYFLAQEAAVNGYEEKRLAKAQ